MYRLSPHSILLRVVSIQCSWTRHGSRGAHYPPGFPLLRADSSRRCGQGAVHRSVVTVASEFAQSSPASCRSGQRGQVCLHGGDLLQEFDSIQTVTYPQTACRESTIMTNKDDKALDIS